LPADTESVVEGLDGQQALVVRLFVLSTRKSHIVIDVVCKLLIKNLKAYGQIPITSLEVLISPEMIRNSYSSSGRTCNSTASSTFRSRIPLSLIVLSFLFNILRYANMLVLFIFVRVASLLKQLLDVWLLIHVKLS